MPLQIQETGIIPITIEAKYAGTKIVRSFELISRSSVYPAVELQAVSLGKITGLVTALLKCQAYILMK